MRQTTKGLTLGTLLLSAQLLSPLAMASAELPGRGRSAPAELLAGRGLPEPAGEQADGASGFDVQPAQEVDYNVAYASVAQGDGTFLAFNWIPLQDNKYEQAGGDKVFFREGTYVAGAAQGPHRQKTATQYGITNLGQLKDPEVAALFDGDGDGKADLIGCNPAGAARGDQPSPDAFGLTPRWPGKQGNYAALIADTLVATRPASRCSITPGPLLAQQRTGAGQGCGVAGSPRRRPGCGKDPLAERQELRLCGEHHAHRCQQAVCRGQSGRRQGFLHRQAAAE